MRPSFLLNQMTLINNKYPLINIPGLFLLLTWLAAIFFHGQNIHGLLATQTFLVLGFTSSLLILNQSAIKIPNNLLLLSLFSFSLWLILSLNWSLAPQVSRLVLWTILSLPAAFIIYTFANISDRNWYFISLTIISVTSLLAINVIWLAHNHNGQLSSLFLNPNSLSALFNLVILFSASCFLRFDFKKYSILFLGISLFILIYAIGLIQSRGAILCLLISLLGLIIVCRALINKTRLLALVAIILLGLLGGTIEIHHSIATPLEIIFSGERLDQGRLAIWQPSWELVKASPWVGSGIGLFWLLYPKVRLNIEASGGFYAHNDYLQLWIEAGLPAIILLLIIFFTALLLYMQIFKFKNNSATKLEASGLFFGLLAVAAHSIVTFNFYILSILVLCGIYLGRLNQLSITPRQKMFSLCLPKTVNPYLFYGMLLIISGIPLKYILAEGIANQYQHTATAQIAAKNYVDANVSLHNAQKWLKSDALMLDHAALYYRVLQILPPTETQRRKALYTNILRILSNAERMNPLRSRLYLLRGQLYSEHLDLGDINSSKMAHIAFTKAIMLNPRNLRARFGQAQLYIAENKSKVAFKLLNDGLHHYYHLSVDLLPYLRLYRQLEPNQDSAIRPTNLNLIIENLTKSKLSQEK